MFEFTDGSSLYLMHINHVSLSVIFTWFLSSGIFSEIKNSLEDQLCFLFFTKCIENAEAAFSCHCSISEEVQSHLCDFV